MTNITKHIYSIHERRLVDLDINPLVLVLDSTEKVINVEFNTDEYPILMNANLSFSYDNKFEAAIKAFVELVYKSYLKDVFGDFEVECSFNNTGRIFSIWLLD